MLKITQGESFLIFLNLKQSGMPLTPELVSELKICIGEDFSKSYPGGGLGFDTASGRWWFKPGSEETMALPEGNHKICGHFTYPDGTVIIRDIDRIQVRAGCCGGG